eukprot:TRINITY_DN85152_c0_g1_i1.p1 TRINITY_DN85152_c0_g1~~TRINITY_DN85152_c0_g1_i1.p1  ORF type:complete len:180 (-),score=7.43 TRINITY_DN85152_c0_g1_i1:185-688(-)
MLRYVHQPYSLDGPAVCEGTQETPQPQPQTPPRSVPCEHLSAWKHQRSRKGRVFVHCRQCLRSFSAETTVAQNFRLLVIPMKPPAWFQQPGRGPQCCHVTWWKRDFSRWDRWHFHCTQCGDRWDMPTASKLRHGAEPPRSLTDRGEWPFEGIRCFKHPETDTIFFFF